jgi:hypothetical protein
MENNQQYKQFVRPFALLAIVFGFIAPLISCFFIKYQFIPWNLNKSIFFIGFLGLGCFSAFIGYAMLKRVSFVWRLRAVIGIMVLSAFSVLVPLNINQQDEIIIRLIIFVFGMIVQIGIWLSGRKVFIKNDE